MASENILVFNREMTVDGKVYPAGAIVPYGVLTPPKLQSLRDSNRIIEVRADELATPPLPHRVPQLDQKLLFAARELRDQKQRELDAAQAQLDWLEAVDAADNEPIEPAEPETRGTTRDFEDVGKVDDAGDDDEPQPAGVTEVEAGETVEAEDGDEDGDGDDEDGDDEVAAEKPRRARRPQRAELPPQLG